MPLRFDTKTGEPKFEMHAADLKHLLAAQQILLAVDKSSKGDLTAQAAATTIQRIIDIYPVRKREAASTGI